MLARRWGARDMEAFAAGNLMYVLTMTGASTRLSGWRGALPGGKRYSWGALDSWTTRCPRGSCRPPPERGGAPRLLRFGRTERRHARACHVSGCARGLSRSLATTTRAHSMRQVKPSTEPSGEAYMSHTRQSARRFPMPLTPPLRFLISTGASASSSCWPIAHQVRFRLFPQPR